MACPCNMKGVLLMKEYKIKKEDIKQLVEIEGSCIASDRITVDGRKVVYMYRENPSNDTDSGWRFFAGNEDEEYTNNANNFEIYDLNTICNYDQSIIPYLNNAIGSKLVKKEDGTYKFDE